MKLQVGVIALAALAIGACSPAPPACNEPVPPRAIDPSTANDDQMLAARDVVQRFIKDSDSYQLCLVSAVKERDKNPPWYDRFYDDGFKTDVARRIRANQSMKEKVGNGFNQAVRSYNAVHP